MSFVALKFFERIEVRIAIVQADNETYRHLIVLEMIEERSSIGRVVQWPAYRMDDETRLMLGWIDFP